MKKQNKDLIAKQLKTYQMPNFDHSRIEETILQSKNIILKSQQKSRTAFLEFFKVQFTFIRKRVWAIQLLIVMSFCVLSGLLSSSTESIKIFPLLSIAAPLVVLTSVPEIACSFTHNMMEIEMCTKYSLNKLVIVRLSIFGITDLISLTFFMIISNFQLEIGIYRIILYLFVPFNLTCIGCLWIINHIMNKDNNYYCMAYGLFLMLIAVVLAYQQIKIYEVSTTGIWLAILIASFVAIGMELRKMLINCKSIGALPIS